MDNKYSFEQLSADLKAPVIAAPMYKVSSPELALSCSSSGILGSFSAHTAEDQVQLDEWIDFVQSELTKWQKAECCSGVVPYAVNLVTHSSNRRVDQDFSVIKKYRVPVVITSKGAPSELMSEVHAYGGIVLHNVSTKRHAEIAIQSGVDGVIAVSHGAGGHTGVINPFALVNEIRSIWDGPLILGGAISTGQDVLSALVMGADMAYMGTRFIMGNESLASERYKSILSTSSAKDILITDSIDDIECSFLLSTLEEFGYDKDLMSNKTIPMGLKKEIRENLWKSVLSAGQGVGIHQEAKSTVDIVDEVINEFFSGLFRLEYKMESYL